jgi:hypothetical protein
MANHLTHKTVDSLINQALAIEDESAQDAGSLGFMARAMVQATLPHRKVEGNIVRAGATVHSPYPMQWHRSKHWPALWVCPPAAAGLGHH